MNKYRDKLDDIIRRGVALDLYHAEEALSLDQLIGQKANEINEATFGALFGSLQIILGRYLVLYVARIFERPSVKYPTRSIPSAIAILRENGMDLPIEQRPGLIAALVRRGVPRAEMEALSDRELTSYVVSFFEQRLSAVNFDGVANARALDALKTMRDKVVAHSEAVRLEDMPKPTYAEIDELVALARTFVATVGSGYLSIIYEADDGSNFMSGDARRSTICLMRLLQTADVLPKRH